MRKFIKFLILAMLSTTGLVDRVFSVDLTVQEIAVKMKTAPDPNGAYRNCKSYFLKQEMTTDKNKATMEATFKTPDMSKSVTLLDGKIVYTVIFNNGKSWSIDASGTKKEITGIELDRMIFMNKMQEPHLSLTDIFSKIDLSEAKIGQMDCYVLKCSTSSDKLDPMTFFVDKKDFLTKKIETEKNGKTYSAEIKKYSLVQGVLVASETLIEYMGSKQTLILVDYRLNVDVPDSEFAP